MPFICTLSNKTFQFARKVFPAVFSGLISFIKRNFEIKKAKNKNMKCKDSLGTWGRGYAVFFLKKRDR